MKRLLLALLVSGATVCVAGTTGCASSTKSPDVRNSVRTSLDQANLKDVTVSQDLDKGVVTLGGHVSSDTDNDRAMAIAKTIAPNQVIADEIQVLPPGGEATVKKVDASLDAAADHGIDAALTANHLDNGVHHSVEIGVATLTGTVDTAAKRSQIEKLVSQVASVTQVVNKIEVKNQKATSSPGR